MSRRVFSGEALRAIGSRIRDLRRGRTQAEFAELIGISRGSLSNYEAGRRLPSGDVLDRLEAVTGYSKDWLFSGREESPPVRIGDIELTDDDMEAILRRFNLSLLDDGQRVAIMRTYRSFLKERLEQSSGEKRNDIEASIADVEWFLSLAAGPGGDASRT